MSIPAMLVIAQAEPSDFPAVRALIVKGLAERWVRYEPSFNPDLEAFHDFYVDAVVLTARDYAEIIGCGILLNENESTARIVRMSVLAERQRMGIGSQILTSLLERANRLGYKEVVLETTATWESAVTFYKHHGFIPTNKTDGDQHFRFALNQN